MKFPYFQQSWNFITTLVCTEDPARCSAYPICAMCISEELFNG
uniref:Uncharacterized protein n=1 Tax=Arundo donax TaxID=35708 RepID=A0A0A9GS30_ARUDO